MTPLVLSSNATDGDPIQATFLPEQGMNLISYKKGSIEVIDQSTKSLFEERFAGLGALIGPHFHRRNPETLPKIADESLFPHIARVKAKGVADPFSHGIGRYAPWKITASTSHSFSATLTGKDTWNGVPLSALEGQNFTMHFNGNLNASGLHLTLDVVSDYDSLVGIHYYYHLPKGTGLITSNVQPFYLDKEERKPLKEHWHPKDPEVLVFDLNAEEADYTFFPSPDPLNGKILLDADAYKLKTTYRCTSQENAWQLYHPKSASFVCIEPVSAQDPRHPNLTVSAIQISLEIIY
jgi:hypothetical protein